MKKQAIVLLSGGLDSAVTLFYAKRKGYRCRCLAFDYGQRHSRELASSRAVAAAAGAELVVVPLAFPWKGSSLVDRAIDLPVDRTAGAIDSTIPSTYVPARNTIFLSIAASYAEAVGAERIFIGAHVQDASGYPDCRRSYLEAFDRVLALGTKRGIEKRLRLAFPLIGKGKAGIIKLGRSLGVPFEATWSCYAGGREPCGRCDSCILRARGFAEAGIPDPLIAGEKVPVTPRAAVTEIFSSLQGEGIYVGTRQIFIRFKECNLSCAYCDERRERSTVYTPSALARAVTALDRKQGPHHSISLTGGEPLLYADFLKEFLPLLATKGRKIYLETNGTLPAQLQKVIGLVDIVAMDIKIPSATGGRAWWQEHAAFMRLAREKELFVKVVVTPDADEGEIRRAASIVAAAGGRIPFVIQPASPAGGSIRMSKAFASANHFKPSASALADVRVVPQVHKLLRIK